MLQLKLGSIQPPYFQAKYSVDVRARFREPLESLSGDGYLIEASDEVVRLSRQGPPAGRPPAPEVLPYPSTQASVTLSWFGRIRNWLVRNSSIYARWCGRRTNRNRVVISWAVARELELVMIEKPEQRLAGSRAPARVSRLTRGPGLAAAHGEARSTNASQNYSPACHRSSERKRDPLPARSRVCQGRRGGAPG